MDHPPISRFPIPAFKDMPTDIQQRIGEVQEKAGVVPNVFLTLARRPDEFRAFFLYHDALMEKESPGLSRAEREMIVVATSARNQCQYCVIAHGAILRISAFFGLSNRLVNMSSMRTNDEFYLMGRVPREK